MPISSSTRLREARERARRAHAVQPLGAGQVHERLVDRERLDQRRQLEHQLAHLAADAARISPCSGVITTACGQSLQRLEHRHRRMDAVGARDVAGGRDHAALAAADDQRLVGERRIVALLDRGVEGVAVDMRDRRARRAARWRDQPRRAAGRAARRSVRPRRRGSRGRSAGIRVPRAPRAFPLSTACGALDRLRRHPGMLRRPPEQRLVGRPRGRARRPGRPGRPAALRIVSGPMPVRPGTGRALGIAGQEARGPKSPDFQRLRG